MTARVRGGAGTRIATSEDSFLDRYLDARERRRTSHLTITAPIVSVALVVLAYVASVAGGLMPSMWVSHIDGQGNMNFSAHWPLVTVTVTAAVIAFSVAWLLTREHAQAGHWHDLEKGFVVFSVGVAYGLLGVVVANVATSIGRPAEASGPDLMGLGLLGFVLAFIAAAVVHTFALPKARTDRWTPHY